MTTAEAIDRIEQPEFGAYLNLASSYKVFQRLLESDEAVKTLRADINHPGIAESVLGRVRQLANVQPGDEFEHPWDAAMAAYCWILMEAKGNLAAEAASLILCCDRCCWAKKVAQEVKGQAQRPPCSTGFARITIPPVQAPHYNLSAGSSEATQTRLLQPLQPAEWRTYTNGALAQH